MPHAAGTGFPNGSNPKPEAAGGGATAGNWEVRRMTMGNLISGSEAYLTSK